MIANMVSLIGADDNAVVLWAHPTNPLVRPETYYSALWQYHQGNGDSLLSVTRVQRHAWMNGRPINYHPSAAVHPTASDTVPVYF
jgi:CMP-N-acetylneuraminic acid synthetase